MGFHRASFKLIDLTKYRVVRGLTVSLIRTQCYIEVKHQYNHIHSHVVFIFLMFVVDFVFYVSYLIYVKIILVSDFKVFYAYYLTFLLAIFDM